MEKEDLTPELINLKKLAIKILKKGRAARGDECLTFRIISVNEVSHVAHLDSKPANSKLQAKHSNNNIKLHAINTSKTPIKMVAKKKVVTINTDQI